MLFLPQAARRVTVLTVVVLLGVFGPARGQNVGVDGQGADAPTPPPAPPVDVVAARSAHPGSRPPYLIALGISGTGARTRDAGLGDAFKVGPVARLASRSGFGPAIGFSWTRVEVEWNSEGQPGQARVSLRPVMGGLAYNIVHARGVVSASLVGGYSFNSLSPHRGADGQGRAIGVRNGPVWRAGVSTWYDLTHRTSVNVFVGGLFATPRVTFADDEGEWTERLRADALVVSAGIAWWIY